MLEKDIEDLLVREVKKLGGLCIKLISQSSNGLPDRLVLMPGEKLYFVELKSSKGRLRKLQEFWASRLGRLGFDVRSIDSREKVEEFIEELGEKID